MEERGIGIHRKGRQGWKRREDSDGRRCKRFRKGRKRREGKDGRAVEGQGKRLKRHGVSTNSTPLNFFAFAS